MSERDVPGSNSDSDSDLDFEELADWLGQHRYALMTALSRTEGRATTRTLRRRTDVPRGSFSHHMEQLAEWNLVVEAGRVETHGQGSPSRVWELTPCGEDFVAYLRATGAVEVTGDDITALKEQLARLEDRQDTLEERLEKLRKTTKEVVGMIGEKIDDIEDQIDTIDPAETHE
ncbi:helix-turn-helix domain-containing protein [Halegenticoccus soli]|uniref:hypothetical protein n=1 Tax=Halegenticoccus soli TaxID=1985678 RepID=UPI000C6D39D2|nr:hypothetical protein [Halegenticoccus soli]